MEFSYFLIILVLVGVVWYVGGPLLAPVMAENTSRATDYNEAEDLRLRKEEVFLSLKDLELDYKTKKISEEDYNLLHNEIFKQGTELLKSSEKIQADRKSNPINAQKVAKFCTQCGSALVSGAKFCGECGCKI